MFDNDGSFLGIPDLFDPDSALAVEFDGEQHREREQHRRDNLREEGSHRARLVARRACSPMMRTTDRWRILIAENCHLPVKSHNRSGD